MRAQSSITSGQCTTGLALCARNVLAAHPPCQRPSTTTARRTANPQGREAPTSHPHQHNHQHEVMRSISSKQEPGWRIQGRFWHPLGCLIGDNPHPIGAALEENQMEEVPSANPTYPITSVFLTQSRWPLPSTNLELHKTFTRDAELYELKVKS